MRRQNAAVGIFMTNDHIYTSWKLERQMRSPAKQRSKVSHNLYNLNTKCTQKETKSKPTGSIQIVMSMACPSRADLVSRGICNNWKNIYTWGSMWQPVEHKGPYWFGHYQDRYSHYKARFPLPELTGDRFPLPINTGRVDGRVFPLAELTGLNTARQLG